MITKFSVGLYDLEVTDEGLLHGPDGVSSAAPGCVGIQVTGYDRPEGYGPGEEQKKKTLMQAFMRPSAARALASSILSAATEARG